MKKLASIAAGLLLGSALAMSSAMGRDGRITWQMWAGGEEDVAGWQEIADLVHKQYPDIKVELQTAPWGDYWTKLAAQAHRRPDDRHLLAAVAAHAELPSADGARSGPYIERDDFPIERVHSLDHRRHVLGRQSLRPAIRSRHAAGILQQGPLRGRRPRAHQ